MWIILLFFAAHWYLSAFSQTFFLHRYASHSMFTMNKFWERFFYIFTYISQGSSYLSAKYYGAMHRIHHAYADTEKDVHSPKNSDNLFAMMWDTKHIYNLICDGKMAIEDRFKKNLPTWESFEKFAHSNFSRILWGLGYIGFYIAFAEHWWLYLLLPIHFLMGPFHGVIINWCSHKFGYRNFDVSNTSTNFLPVDFLVMGECYHNNHHKHGARANFGGQRWHEIDPTYIIMKVLNRLHIIRLKIS